MSNKQYDPKRMMTGKPSEMDKLIRLIRRLITLAVFIAAFIGVSTFIPVKTAKYDTTLFNYIRYHGKPTTFEEIASSAEKAFERELDKEGDEEVDKNLEEFKKSLYEDDEEE
jgi:hypothetical protein